MLSSIWQKLLLRKLKNGKNHDSSYFTSQSVTYLQWRQFPQLKKSKLCSSERLSTINMLLYNFSLLTKYPKDAYLCLACSYNDEDSLNSGESIEDALKMIKRIAPPALKGIGVNCTKPPYISKFGRIAREIFPELTLVTYPNSGEEWHRTSCKLHTKLHEKREEIF